MAQIPSPADVTLELLQFLHCLSEVRSVSSAAKQLKLSTPKGSRLLKQARDVFGDELFVRHGADMVPTAFMQDMEPRLLTAVSDCRQLFVPDVFEVASYERVVRISANDCATATILMPAIAEIRKRAPKVRFELLPHDRQFIAKLGDGDLDIGIAPRNAMHSNAVMQQTLYKSMHTYLVRKGHPLHELWLKTGQLPREEIEKYECIRIGTIIDDDSWLSHLTEDLPKQQTAVVLHHVLAAPALLRKTDLTMLVPGKYVLGLEHQGLAALPCSQEQNLFERAMYWHRSTHLDPGLQWIRAMIVVHGAALTDASAVDIVFGKNTR